MRSLERNHLLSSKLLTWDNFRIPSEPQKAHPGQQDVIIRYDP
ncbi:hypothetical protein XBFM1_390013 [Xenorhabdus bovienii str. feltiae Moldova]|uniref:Uncharacterized protein n=1 Tax=Xenorhabdus bovienii str. feltiae Moldova TaxID=1398200 RepID=A0A077NWK1_XENBV|nr:hypothetical protein XBFM1_390013 [Xenorhabdus bovienii str. feltiae Moldova]